MLFAGLLLAVAVEVIAFVAVGEQIHFLPALALLLLVSASGPLIVKRVGLGVLGHARERLEQGDLPTGELLDGVLVLAGGALLCVPGFVGDAVGLALMVAPARHLVIRLAGRRLARRVREMEGVQGARVAWPGRARRARVVDAASRDGAVSHRGPADERPAGPDRLPPGSPGGGR